MFNTGDYVVCVESIGSFLTEGKPYQILAAENGLVRVMNDKNVIDCYSSKRFKSINIVRKMSEKPLIERAFTNGPATIVLWGDGIKTVAKCGKDDVFDAEKGLAIAISKRFLGNDFKPTFEQFLIKDAEKTKRIKVGDFVRIRDGYNIPDYAGNWVLSMKKYVGKIFRVSRINKSGVVELEGNSWLWDVRGLEKVERKENK